MRGNLYIIETEVTMAHFIQLSGNARRTRRKQEEAAAAAAEEEEEE